MFSDERKEYIPKSLAVEKRFLSDRFHWFCQRIKIKEYEI